MVNNYIKSEKEILDDLINRYLRLGFGKILKSEIDLLMFDTIVQKYLSDNNKNSLLLLNQADIYTLSQKLKIPESKVNSYIEALCLYTGALDKDKGEVLDTLISMLKEQKQKKERLEKGEFALQITNKTLRNAIKNYIINLNQQVDYSFNNEILVFDIVTLLSLFNKDQKEFVEFLMRKKEEAAKIEELNKWEPNKGTELLKKGISIFFARITNTEPDFINEVFDFLSDKIKNR